ncbi:MAG: hypothetical protein Q9Q40_08205 [Acidobacteriota bacterium]|nr:hypothetical protein [Acidobacteriota bacterium]
MAIDLAREIGVLPACRARGVSRDTFYRRRQSAPGTGTRPHVSDDNPYSEAHFKTIEYQPGFPNRSCGHDHAISHGRVFFPWYDNHHHHRALARLTPADVHFGRTTAVIQERQRVLDDAFRAHPERFVHGRPRRPDPPPPESWIDPPMEALPMQMAQ